MKKIYILIIILFSLSLVVFSQSMINASSRSVDSYSLQYCTNSIDGGIAFGETKDCKVAVRHLKKDVSKFVDCNVVRVLIGLKDGIDGVISLKMVVKKSVTGVNIYTQDVDVSKLVAGWNEITLNEPFYISGFDDLVVGYEAKIKGNKKILGYSTNEAHEDGGWLHNGLMWSRTNANFSVKAIVEGENMIQYDAELSTINVDKTVRANVSFEIKGTVKNVALKDITSFDVSYKMDAEEPVTCNISLSKSIVTNDSYEFTHTIPAILDKEGEHSIKITISNVNGEELDGNAKNNSPTHSVNVIESDTVVKKVLLEQFTTEECPNCPSGTNTIASVVGDNENVVWVSHHAGFKTDDYTIPYNTAMLRFFGGGSYAPALMLDRTKLPESSTGSKYPVFQTGYITPDMLNKKLKEPAKVSIVINGTYDKAKREISVDVSGKFISAINDKNLALNLFILENGIFSAQQSGSGGSYTHNHLLRHVLSDTSGDAVNEVVGGTYSKNYKYTVPQNWNDRNIKIVAFIANYESDVNNCKVYNAEEISLQNLTTPKILVRLNSNLTSPQIVLKGGGMYSEGQTVVIKAIVEGNGIKFLNWKLGDDVVSTEPIYQFKMGKSEVNYTANFETGPKVSLSANIPAAAKLLVGEGYYNANTEVEISVTPNDGYEFINWTQNGTTVATTLEHTFTIGEDDVSFVANFVKYPQVILSANPSDISTTLMGAGFYKSGEVVKIVVTAVENYDFVNWTQNGTAIATTLEHTFTIGEDDVSFVANFVKYPQVTLSANPSDISTTLMGAGFYKSGETVKIVATAVENYDFVNWTQNGTAVATTLEHTFTIGEDDVSFVANFVKYPRLILLESPEGASKSLVGAGFYKTNTSVTVSTIPNKDYQFINWTLDGAIVSFSEEYSFVIENNTTIIANFEYKGIIPAVQTVEPDKVLSICPNPVISRQFAIVCDDAQSLIKSELMGNNALIEIYNLAGQLQLQIADYEIQPVGDRIIINCQLKNGTYLIKIADGKPIKFIVNRK